MKLSIVLLAVILFLFGLMRLTTVVLSSQLMGWLMIVDAVLFLLEPAFPQLVINWPTRRDPAQ